MAKRYTQPGMVSDKIDEFSTNEEMVDKIKKLAAIFGVGPQVSVDFAESDIAGFLKEHGRTGTFLDSIIENELIKMGLDPEDFTWHVNGFAI